MSQLVKFNLNYGLFLFLIFLSACAPNFKETSPISAPLSPGTVNSPTPIPIWVTQEMTDINSGKPFNINDFKGKVVLVDGIATWCPTCFKESLQMKALNDFYGEHSDLVTISLGWDMKEDDSVLKSYSKQFNFNWRFAIVPLPIFRDLGNTYGALYLDPTLSPMFAVDRYGNVQKINLGYKTVDDLKQIIDPLISQ